MLVTSSAARTKWCPFVRVENSNRDYAMLMQGPESGDKLFRCIGDACMAWRQFHLSHVKSAEGEAVEAHGYCGLAGRPEQEQSW